MIKKIKANYVEIKDDLVIIRRTSFRIIRLFQGIVFGLLLSIFFVLIKIDVDGNVFAAIISFCAFAGFFYPKKEEIYTVPRKDLIIIKNYPNRHKVTVVFDDEKMRLKLFD